MPERKLFNDVRFTRSLSLWRVMTRGLGVVIVLTLFVLIGKTIAVIGSLSPVILLVAAFFLLINLLGYVELAMSISRPGGAYPQVYEARGDWLAFLTGWALILASLGVGALLTQGFALHVITFLRQYLETSLPVWFWAGLLVLVMAINQALGTRGRRHGQLIVAMLGLILVMAIFSVPSIDLERYTFSQVEWRHMLPLLLVPFVGVEIVASLQGDMRLANRDAPRALFLTPILAALFSALILSIAIGALGVDVLADSPISMIQLGSEAFGELGKLIVLLGGALGIALSLGIVLKLVTRQIYLMSRDGYWPASLRKLHPRFGTPIGIIALVALLLFGLTFLPSNLISYCVGLLFLLTLMVVNLTLLLRSQEESASFSLPFHPWVSALVLIIDFLVFPLVEGTYLLIVAGLILAGVLIYFAYARGRHVKAKEGVTVFKPKPEERPRKGYRILVPIANPDTAGFLLRLAGVLARQNDGEVLTLQVVTVPDQIPLEEGRFRAASGRELLERALRLAKKEDFSLQTMARVAHSVAEGILDTAREEKVDLILLGWRGYTRTSGASMGPIIDPVIRDAPCEISIAKVRQWESAEKILVLTSGGPNAPAAARLASQFARMYDSEVTALYVQLGQATPQRIDEKRELIQNSLKGIEFEQPPEQKVIVADSVVGGVVQEVTDGDYDLVLLGASEEGVFDQFAFGSIPQQIATQIPRTAVMVKHYGGPTELWSRKLFQGLSQILPALKVEEQLELRETMRDSARPGVNYFVLTILSSLIATLGLLLNSPAVVIGAMLVAPLMSPIMGFSLGVIVGDVRLMRFSVEAVLKGFVLAVLISAFATFFSPFNAMTREILIRTQPTLVDMVIALASGMAGAYALARKGVGAALPGVAIAAALMPPLGVVGIGLALGDAQIVAGSLLLFVTNIAAISLAGVIIFLMLGVRPEIWLPEAKKRVRRSLVAFVILLILIAIPLGVIMNSILRDTARQRAIQAVLQEQVVSDDRELVEVEYRPTGGSMLVVATVRSKEPIDQDAVDDAAAALNQRLDQPVILELVTLPVLRSGD
jgi:uncharacterized hydrophobic protein (TIGR00271 family)